MPSADAPAVPGRAPGGARPARAGLRRPAVFAACCACGVALDQLAKWLVFRMLAPGEVWPLWRDVLHFRTAENPGAAFGLFSSHPRWLAALALGALPLLGWWYARARREAPGAFLWALALICAGAAGNVVDRLAFGVVRDFMDFVPPLPLIGKWATFNLADSFLCVGVGLLLLVETCRRPESKPDPPPPAR